MADPKRNPYHKALGETIRRQIFQDKRAKLLARAERKEKE